MARMSEAQLKKLSPAERKARAARLAYNKKYDASKRDGKTTKRAPAKKTSKPAARAAAAIKSSAKSTKSDNEGLEALKSAISEFEAVQARREELIATMQLLLENA